MKSGVYALLRRDGAPIARDDGAELGLSDKLGAAAAPSCVIDGRDVEFAGARVSRAIVGDRSIVFVGDLTDPDLAGRYGLAADTPPAILAHRAWQEHGADLALHLDGEWSLLQWDADARELTVSISWASRDAIHYAESGNDVAVAPAIALLARLPWVDASYDLRGMCLHFAQAGLRSAMSNETPLVGVKRVPPGGTEIFGTRRSSLTCDDPALPPRWTGSFEEAIEAFDALLDRNLRRQLAGRKQIALTLSGGLDSSTLAMFAQRALPRGASLVCYTSVAPSRSGLDDEAAYARLVSDALDLPLVDVVPDPDASAYIPSRRTFDHNEIPIASPRHYLYDAFYDHAERDGADLLLDGAYGEGTITYWPPRTPSAPAWRQLAKRLLRPRRRQHSEVWDTFADHFHARLAPDVLAAFERSQGGPIRSRPGKADLIAAAGEQFGYLLAMRKNAMTPTTSPLPSLRHVYPFRERNLIRLMASMPTSFVERFGGDRVIARRLIAGRLPDAIVRRKKSGMFSPDFSRRLQCQTGQVLDLLPSWRRGDANGWLDLDWLELQLKELRAGGKTNLRQLYRIQTTTIGAAYFAWMRSIRT